MGHIFETLMMICFGLSWPFNIAKSYRARTAKGKSLLFECVIICGYLLGITGKIVSDNVTYVVAVYVLDVCMVTIDLMLSIRNVRLDKQREKEAASA